MLNNNKNIPELLNFIPPSFSIDFCVGIKWRGLVVKEDGDGKVVLKMQLFRMKNQLSWI